MALFDWEETLSVNIKAVDEQHKYLVKLINDLYRSLLSDNPGEKMGNILDRMLLYATYHFQDEEKLMGLHQYPWLHDHKQKHLEFTDKTLEYLEKFRAGELKPSTEIAKFLKTWVKAHIVGEDKRYSAYLNERGVY